jgi:hypothetical protein
MVDHHSLRFQPPEGCTLREPLHHRVVRMLITNEFRIYLNICSQTCTIHL